ncbi:hypothetical protein FO519_002380 [Halicephalobus sp. NKZ332]|nr:hypothetical protein FO519_002380 [Halicephalobus sp. NKZ332]
MYEPSFAELLTENRKWLEKPKSIITADNWPEDKCRTTSSCEINSHKENEKIDVTLTVSEYSNNNSPKTSFLDGETSDGKLVNCFLYKHHVDKEAVLENEDIVQMNNMIVVKHRDFGSDFTKWHLKTDEDSQIYVIYRSGQGKFKVPLLVTKS